MRARETSLLNHGRTHMQNSDTHWHTNLVHKTEKCVANLLILPVYNATSFVDQKLHIHTFYVASVLCHLHFSGAGQEVGRSCIMLEYKGKKIMVG